jgi:hypothetical protein
MDHQYQTPRYKKRGYLSVDGYRIVKNDLYSPIAPKQFELPGSPDPLNQIMAANAAPKLNYKNKNKPQSPLIPNNKQVVHDTDRENTENKKQRQALAKELTRTPNKPLPEQLAAAQLNAQNAQQDISPLAERLNDENNDFVMNQPQPNNIFDNI